MKYFLSLIAFVLIGSYTGYSQLDAEPALMQHQALSFIQNKGQWHENVRFRAPLGTGSVYLENNVLTYTQLDPEDIDIAHHHSGETEHQEEHLIDGHAWRAHFVGANTHPELAGEGKKTEYHNYFIGNDPSKWASRVPLFNAVTYSDLYDGIDMKVYSAAGFFKYDFIVAPHANASSIAMAYAGLDRLEIRNGNLISVTSIGEFIENAPYAYQLIDGVKQEVLCQYVLTGNIVTFEFPKGYNPEKPLIIDPELVGATLSGGTATNYGHCATYDNDGNIYSGARCFGAGYPTEDGSFQTSFGGGVDIAVSKLSPDATTLLYATYLGGAGQDLPHSMVVSESDELYVFGSSRSLDYPVSADAFDTSGPDGGITTDIIVTHLTEDGTGVIGSTFVGGNQDDGLNTLTSNYGDNFRGEIVVDFAGNCYIASCTKSADFPSTAGAYQEAYGGGAQDGVIFSMPPDLSSLNWSTYLGGSFGEGALGLRLDASDNLYVSGVTSGEFITMTGYQTSYQGGDRDAFVIHLASDGSSIMESSYWGTTARDAAFFVDLDIDGNVYLYGQSNGGTSEVTPGVYSNAGSHQFICELSPNLEDLELATVVGSGGADFIPIAFMVDGCGFIYFSGHSASGVLPLTDDALFVTGGFYLGVLQPDAVDLEFATKYSGNHVDGGTSRFDPANGTVYQAVCSCEPFTTTPGAYGTTPGGFCDIGVFKINFGIVHVNATAEAAPSSEGCAPYTVTFDNTSSGVSFEWNFDDGAPVSTDFEPTHTFTDPGVYNVRLIAYDPEGCLTSDTTYIEIIVGSGETPEASFDYDVNCATGEVTVTFTGTDGAPVLFDMGDGSSYTDPEVSHTYLTDGIFTITLTAGDGVCADFATETADISIGTPAVDIIFNNPSCTGFSDGSLTLDLLSPTGDEVIEITDGDGTILNIEGSNTANTLNAGWYYYHVELEGGCELTDSIQIMDPPRLNAQLQITDPLCFGDKTGSVVVDTVYNWQGSYDEVVYLWAPDPDGISGVGADMIENLGAGNYTITLNDDAGCSRTFDFTIKQPAELVFSEYGYDPSYCRVFDYQSGGGVVYAAATGGVPHYTYQWENLETGETTVNTTWGGLNPGTYQMTVTDENGCTLVQSLELDSLNPIADFSITIDQLKTDCDAVVPVDISYANLSQNYLNPKDPTGEATFLWNFDYDNIDWVISHDVNDSYTINYAQSGTYTICLTTINFNGCENTTCKDVKLCNDLVFEIVNIFSPDGDGKNDQFNFTTRSEGVLEFNCLILDRWGVKIAEFNSINAGWDGTDKQGNLVPDGVYFYKYAGKGETGEKFSGQGTVQKVSEN